LPTRSWKRRKDWALVNAVIAVALWLGATPAISSASPPVNDDYLQSLRIVDDTGQLPRGVVQDLRDTTEATVQSDLFGPSAVGGGVEPTVAPSACGGVGYGKTVWYDFAPKTAGAVEIRTSGPENVVVLYRFDGHSSLLGPVVACAAPSNSTDLVQAVKAGEAYTVQVGGVDRGLGPAAGPTSFGFEYFSDADGDDVLDDLDKCPAYPGPSRFGGCPATIDARSSVALSSNGGGQLSLTALTVTGPRGTRVVVRCHRRCKGGDWTATVGPSRRAVVRSLADVRVMNGSQIDVYLTKTGFFGRFLRYTVRGSDLNTAHRCLLPVRDPKPRNRCAAPVKAAAG
jgi:hypothetical protein